MMIRHQTPQEEREIRHTFGSLPHDVIMGASLYKSPVMAPETDTEYVCVICYTANTYIDRRRCCQSRVCTTCFRTYLETRIKDGNIKIPCPACERLVEKTEVSQSVSGACRDLYIRYTVNACADPSVKTCPRCCEVTNMHPRSSGMSFVRKRGLEVSCTACGLRWCFPCQAPAHEGLTCREYQQGDTLLSEWADFRHTPRSEVNARRCPKCKVWISRISGCDHMTCKCNTNFCYACGKTFRKNIFGRHENWWSINGCDKHLLPDHPLTTKAIRILLIVFSVALVVGILLGSKYLLVILYAWWQGLDCGTSLWVLGASLTVIFNMQTCCNIIFGLAALFCWGVRACVLFSYRKKVFKYVNNMRVSWSAFSKDCARFVDAHFERPYGRC